MGLRFFDHDLHLESARLRVQWLIDQLKSCYLLLPSDRDGHVKMHDVVRDFGLIEASSGEHVYLSRHNVQLNEWPLNDEVEPYTAISIGSQKDLDLPLGLDCSFLQFLQLSGKINISRDYFSSVKDLRVVFLRFKLISFSHENMLLESPPKELEFLMNVQTLCLEGCKFTTGIGLIGSMHKLQILSINQCEINVLPREIGQLINLKLLDLRGTRLGSIVRGVLSCLKKLEDLYMGDCFKPIGVEIRNLDNSANITEQYSLSSLKTLQVYLSKEDVSELKDISFDMLKRFDISLTTRFFYYDNDEFLNWMQLKMVHVYVVHCTEFGGLLRRAEVIELEQVKGQKYIMKEADEYGCMNLKKLTMHDNEEVVEICEGNLPPGSMGKLEELDLHAVSGARHLWRGIVQPPSFVNLKVITIRSCNKLVNLFSWSAARCLVQLQKLTFSDCFKLEEIVSKDGAEYENGTEIFDFPKVKQVEFTYLPSFKNFVATSSSNHIQSFFNEVSLPSMETLFLNTVDVVKLVGGKRILPPYSNYGIWI